MANEKIKAVAREVVKSVMFDLDDSVQADLENFFEEHLKEIDNLKSINTDGVKPMTRIDSAPISFLREDVPDEALPKEKLLANASETHQGFVSLPRKGEQND